MRESALFVGKPVAGRLLRRLAVGAALLSVGVTAAAAEPPAGPDASFLWAAQSAPPGLPPNADAQAAIDGDPGVIRAREALQAARHRSDALRAGPYEWTARAGVQQRRYRDVGENSNEGSLGIERALRIGGKAELDLQLGETAIRIAEARHGEARHEAARTLLELWLGWRAADGLQTLWREQLAAAEANFMAASTRRRAGDASLIEQNAAQIDRAESQRGLSGAVNESAKAAARLRARFPGLPLDSQQALGEPALLEPHVSLWRERILGESDELRAVVEEQRRAELTAARMRAERIPDPTVGMHVGTEARRNERIVGVTISIPLGGRYREAQAGEAHRLAEAARSAVEATRRELEAGVAANLIEAGNSVDRWRLAEESLALGRENVRLTQRGYSLGETELQTVLLARRQAVDAALGAAQARSDALQARWRLLIDAHLIWGLQED